MFIYSTIRKITGKMPVLIVRRGCCPYLCRVSLARIPRIPKEKLDSCLRRNDIEGQG
jgi:hypothetical protein